jgi:hypothetical protein
MPANRETTPRYGNGWYCQPQVRRLVAQARLLEQTVPQGMKKLIAAIEDASRRMNN